MKANVGSIDRTIRVVVGIALLALLFLAPAPQKWFGLLGFVALGTASLSFCPLYTLLGINTGSRRE